MRIFRVLLAVPAILAVAAACAGDDAAVTTTGSQAPSPPTVTTASVATNPSAAETNTTLVVTASPGGTSPNIIFFNGQVVTMEPDPPQAQALAVRADTIVAVGSDQEVMALRGAGTQLIDLGGRALLPGFVDPHTHPLGQVESAESLDRDQQYALEGGLTSIGETSVSPEKLERIELALESTTLRIRTSLYLAYNSKCSGVLSEGWILDRSPILDPAQMLRIPGVKIFADPAGPNLTCGWGGYERSAPARVR